MTEKRFTLKYINEQHISANLYDDKTFIGAIRIGEELIVELLNNLSEENEQLEKQLASINRLIDNKIDEFKTGDYGDLPCNTIHMFLDLKEEIGDLE